MNSHPFSISLKWHVGLPLVLLLLFTPWSSTIDQLFAQWFFQHGQFSNHPFWLAIYSYAILPAWILAVGAALGYLFSFFYAALRPWRLAALFLVLALSIGSGLVIHTSKEYWGRPRPKQVQIFGGQQPFRPYYQPNFFQQPEPSKSFPSGHASMGFYFFSLILLGRHYRNRLLYAVGFILSFLLGGLLSLARIAQGGHFLSDVLISALVMWFISIGLYYWLIEKEHHERTHTEAA